MVERARWSELSSTLAYQLLQLRGDVFVVEQACAYADLDGHDAEDSAEHRWLTDPAGTGTVVACLRVVDDWEHAGARRIGRVVTRADFRGRGLAARLVRSVIDEVGARTELTLHAQAHLVDWYGQFGFLPDGPEYLDDGIPHVPMVRPGGRDARASTGVGPSAPWLPHAGRAPLD
jgi:ElaA protein